MLVYAQVNKDTLKFIREEKEISYQYIDRITKFTKARLDVWESTATDKYPTIKQAKTIAKCYRVPFAGLYMNPSDIKLRKSPKLRNLRTLQNANTDDTALNLAVLDVLTARDLLMESKKALNENIVDFDLQITTDNVEIFAESIRKLFGIDINEQYRCKSARKFYLYVREKIENKGIFVHCFSGVSTDIVRGFAIYDVTMPVIGINDEDRYPAKTFSIIHELVHIFKRSSAICNDMYNSFSLHREEVFCNAVAGEVLVPKSNLKKQIGSRISSELDFDVVEELALRFSVSKEVVCRRLLDLKYINAHQYQEVIEEIRMKFEIEKEVSKEARKISGKGIPRNMSREAIDKTSTELCKAFYMGYGKGVFDKQDISRYLGIKQTHIEKFLWEVSKWTI